MKQRQQSSTSYPVLIFMASDADHITGVTGLTPTVTLSKNGGAFASAAGTVSEIGSGWYSLAGNATDRGTVGELVVHATGTGADPYDTAYTIVPWDPFDAVRLGLTALPNASPAANGGLPTVNGSNYVAGIQGTLNTLDGLDTAQDAQHATTQAGVTALGTPLQAGDYTAPDNSGIAAILADTGTDGVAVSAGAISSIQSGLATSTALTTVADNITTLLARVGAFTGTGVNTILGFFKALASKSASTPSDLGGTYDASTDSTEAIRDRGDAAWGAGAVPSAASIADAVWDEALSGHATSGTAGAALTSAAAGGSLTVSYSQVAQAIPSPVDSGTITLRRGDSISAALTGLGTIPAGRSKLWFTVKRNPKSDTDAEAIIQIEEGGGLLCLNAAVPTDNSLTSGDGSITVTDANTGALTIALSEAAAALLEEQDALRYDLQYLSSGTVRTLTTGKCRVVVDVTRAVS